MKSRTKRDPKSKKERADAGTTMGGTEIRPNPPMENTPIGRLRATIVRTPGEPSRLEIGRFTSAEDATAWAEANVPAGCWALVHVTPPPVDR